MSRSPLWRRRRACCPEESVLQRKVREAVFSCYSRHAGLFFFQKCIYLFFILLHFWSCLSPSSACALDRFTFQMQWRSDRRADFLLLRFKDSAEIAEGKGREEAERRREREGGREGGGRLVRDSLMLLGKFLCTRFSSAAVSHYIPEQSCLSIHPPKNIYQLLSNVCFSIWTCLSPQVGIRVKFCPPPFFFYIKLSLLSAAAPFQFFLSCMLSLCIPGVTGVCLDNS